MKLSRFIHIALLSLILCCATTHSAHAVDELALSGGHGTASSKWVRLDIVNHFDQVVLLPQSELLHYYLSVAAAWWNWNRGNDAYALGIVPMLRIGNPQGDMGAFYIELGVGPHLFSNVSGSNHHLSTSFEFGSQAGVGLKLSESITLRYSFHHYSNSGIASPNNGINVHMAGIGWAF